MNVSPGKRGNRTSAPGFPYVCRWWKRLTASPRRLRGLLTYGPMIFFAQRQAEHLRCNRVPILLCFSRELTHKPFLSDGRKWSNLAVVLHFMARDLTLGLEHIQSFIRQ